ncbi:sensor histidine kinase [Aquipuribacter sp. MA13-6]|uniref:sensor histidine kinase n=1 Tax=unclassified Aquipuribacter TaxID=2635084 RepID=UPI003EEEB1B8
MRARRAVRSTALVAAALAVVALTALLMAAGVPTEAVVLSVGAAFATAAAGGLVSLLLRRRSLVLQIVVTGLTTVSAVAAGVFVSAQAMFISEHDVAVIGPVLLLSSVVATYAAFLLGTPFERSVEAVAEMTRQLAATPGRLAIPGGIATSELRMLAQEISHVGVRLADAQQRAKQLEESRQELVAWISHDLRSPIASIRAMSEALEDGVVSDRTTTASYHRALRLQSHRLGCLVDDLFELARISSGTLDPEEDLVPVSEVVAESVEGAASRGAARGIALVTAPGAAPQHLVPASELRRVLDNLMDNAIRHTSGGEQVVVAVRAAAEVVTISVTDACGGIPEPDLPHLFEVAFRGDVARTRDSAGGGLGLAIARGLVEARGGRIDVENVPGGCRFTVHLAVATAEQRRTDADLRLVPAARRTTSGPLRGSPPLHDVAARNPAGTTHREGIHR